MFGFGDFDQSGECVYLEIIHDEYRHETITKTTSQYIQIVVRITYPKHTKQVYHKMKRTGLYDLRDVTRGSIRGTGLSLEICPDKALFLYRLYRAVSLQPTHTAARYTQLIKCDKILSPYLAKLNTNTVQSYFTVHRTYSALECALIYPYVIRTILAHYH